MARSGSLSGRLTEERLRSQAVEPFFDEAVLSLHALEIGRSSPEAGTFFPDFTLPDAEGKFRHLSDLVESGPIVLSFSRGRWCPYCVLELAEWNAALADLASAGGKFVAVTGETRGAAKAIRDGFSSPVTVLCDVDHGLALSLGLAFYAGEPTLDFYKERGLDLHALYGSDSGFLPVPATYVIGSDLRIHFAFAEVDFRIRAEPADVVACVWELTRR